MSSERKKKWTPYSPAWEREARAMARSVAPPIYPCMKCSGPVLRGYCCDHCGDSDPSSPPVQP